MWVERSASDPPPRYAMILSHWTSAIRPQMEDINTPRFESELTEHRKGLRSNRDALQGVDKQCL